MADTLIEALMGKWPLNMGMPQSWLDRAQQQTQRDIAAYQQGGVPALMADTGTGQDLAGGFGGITKKVGAIPPFTPIRAYHGSPYDFDRFDLSKIGTGEGAQAYGHGLYFAENPAVAQQYKDTLAGISTQIERDGPQGKFIAMSYDNAAQKGLARKEFDTLKEAQAWTAEQEKIQPKGRMYEVNINASPEQFLDWDKRLSQQSPEVQAAIRSSAKIGPGQPARSDTGDAIYREWFSNPTDASNQLMAQGIPGIRYLDQGSRLTPKAEQFVNQYGSRDAALMAMQKESEAHAKEFGAASARRNYQDDMNSLKGQQTSNYVVFNPDIVEIMKKYGLAGAMPFGIGAMPFGTGNEQQQ